MLEGEVSACAVAEMFNPVRAAVSWQVVDFGDDPVVVNVAMSDITVQITMAVPGDSIPGRAGS
jgi:hypothetical protein